MIPLTIRKIPYTPFDHKEDTLYPLDHKVFPWVSGVQGTLRSGVLTVRQVDLTKFFPEFHLNNFQVHPR